MYNRYAFTGKIEKGSRANLVVLKNDPLKDLNALNDIVCVYNKGVQHTVKSLVPRNGEQLAQEQLIAYNSGNIEAFLAPYSENIKAFDFDGKLLFEGKELMRKRYATFFEKNPNLHCKLVNRMVLGNTVIDQEYVTGIKGVDFIKAIVIYQVENGEIKTVHFLRQ